MRCDLHVHTSFSGMCTVPGLKRICRESYNDPGAVYETLKRRGMDLVTCTDHDSIDAVEALRAYPDFFLSEEVTCRTPGGAELHVGVYHISERQHSHIQRRRDDLPSLIAYLAEQDLFFSINHVFSSLTGVRGADDFALLEDFFPAVETRNGAIPAFCNRSAERYAARLRKAVVGGSDAHTLSPLGRTWTEVPEARNSHEFFRALRRGRARVCGASGGYWKLTRTVAEIGCSMLRERSWMSVLSPLLLAVPAVTLGNYVREIAFAQTWTRRLNLQACGLSAVSEAA